MKRILSVCGVSLWLFSSGAQAGFEEGRHYMVMPFPTAVETGSKIEVREFFWYGCPHCYVLEPGLMSWVKKLPDNVQFVRTPGTSPRWLVHGQAYYTFEALGNLDQLHEAFFKVVQDQPQGYNDEKAIAGFAAKHGVNGTKFGETFHSFGVRLKLEKAKQLNQDLNISSVPSLVVDGKYLTTVAMAGGEPAMLKLLDQLISKAAKERAQKAKKSK